MTSADFAAAMAVRHGAKEKSSVTCLVLPHSWATVVTCCADMKAKIIVTPKKAVVDPQGKAIQTALGHLGYTGVQAVHVGKYLEIEVDGDSESVRKQINDACHKLLSNPVIEDYHFELEA